jgi:LacI family transcriptional regulator
MGRRQTRRGPPHVALIVETSMAYGREILHGVAQYIHESGPWTVYLEHRSLQDPAPPWLENWDGDGIISKDIAPTSRLIRRSGIPTDDLNDQKPGGRRPYIQSDHEAIGALAAEHLLERGFAHFAFFGYPGFAWSRRCYQGFDAAVHAAGYSCHRYHHAQRVSWDHQQISWEAEVEGASRWIAALPKPLGLMACNDFRGLQALDACRRAGVAVPEEAAVIGVDNEILACELAYPPLSSVIPDCRRIGYEAAVLLDRLMNGEPPPKKTTREIPPLGISTRQSTDVTAIADPSLAAAMKFIREHACEGIGVQDVLNHVAISRSVLQRRFRATLGRTIHDAIAGVRIRRIKQLLVETELSLETIAERTGFSHSEYLSAIFRKATESTLAAYRREHAHRP